MSKDLYHHSSFARNGRDLYVMSVLFFAVLISPFCERTAERGRVFLRHSKFPLRDIDDLGNHIRIHHHRSITNPIYNLTRYSD